MLGRVPAGLVGKAQSMPALFAGSCAAARPKCVEVFATTDDSFFISQQLFRGPTGAGMLHPERTVREQLSRA
jgi:hypothetical protein